MTAAQGNATKFGNLRDEVRNFHSNLLQDVQDEQAAVAVEIEEIKGKIGKLEQDLKEYVPFPNWFSSASFILYLISYLARLDLYVQFSF